jgi:hypothetical protein
MAANFEWHMDLTIDDFPPMPFMTNRFMALPPHRGDGFAAT